MRPTAPSSTSEQDFPYGWRYVKRTMPDGTEEMDQVALTMEDVLHPKEGDVIPESKPHEADRRYLMNVFESRPISPAFSLVSSDLLIHWGVEGMGDHSPDVAVFVGLNREPDPKMTSLDLQACGGRCELIVELVSPSTRDNDVVKKKEHYHRIGIPIYVIIDQEKEGGPRYLVAYKRRSTHYVEIESDDKFRVDLPLLGLMIGLRDNRVACFDLRTHEELGDYARIAREWEEAKRRLEEADRRAEQQEQAIAEQVDARQKAERQATDALSAAEKQRQEAEKQRAEAEKQRAEAERAQKEADRQRQQAEKQRQEAEHAQKEADRQRQEAERAQKEADRQSQEAERQRRAREELENRQRAADEQAAQRIRELEEKLRLLQAGGDPANPTA